MTSFSPLVIAPVIVSDPDFQSIHIPVLIVPWERAQIVDTFTLVDSGATSSFIDCNLVKKCGILMTHLAKPLKASNGMEVATTEESSGTRSPYSFESKKQRRGGSSLSLTVKRKI